MQILLNFLASEQLWGRVIMDSIEILEKYKD